MTARIIRAVSNPRVTMLGHPTGRLLLARDSYAVDLDAVIDAAARAGTMIEINANPHRLDLDAVHCRRARQKGVQIVINPDAHSTQGLHDLGFGISVARRAWLTARTSSTRPHSNASPGSWSGCAAGAEDTLRESIEGGFQTPGIVAMRRHFRSGPIAEALLDP